MSYLSEAIEYERHRVFREPGVNPPREPEEAFEAGLLAGAEITLRAYGIWKSGFQRIGASDRTIQEALEDFRAALNEPCFDYSKNPAIQDKLNSGEKEKS